MPRKVLISVIVSFYLIYGAFFLTNRSVNADTQSTPDAATLEAGKNEFFANLCSNHGGVNCSVINEDASVVCNDGTIDESYITIYGVPQCQATIENLNNQQSDFMDKSGCYPPSEMTCIDNQSYQNLYKLLSDSGLATSELGKDELEQCRQQVGEYQTKNADYKQCLIENNNPNFDPSSGKIVLPALKAIFCPMFYGAKASYNSDVDLCVCDSGYFMSDGQCVEANQICQSKYGPSSLAQNGTCIQQTQTKPTTTPNIKPSPNISTTPPINPGSNQTQFSETTNFPTPTVQTPSPTQETKSNFIQNILTSILSSIKNIFRIFQ